MPGWLKCPRCGKPYIYDPLITNEELEERVGHADDICDECEMKMEGLI